MQKLKTILLAQVSPKMRNTHQFLDLHIDHLKIDIYIAIAILQYYCYCVLVSTTVYEILWEYPNAPRYLNAYGTCPYASRQFARLGTLHNMHSRVENETLLLGRLKNCDAKNPRRPNSFRGLAAIQLGSWMTQQSTFPFLRCCYCPQV
jgi:hypothetical protein